MALQAQCGLRDTVHREEMRNEKSMAFEVNIIYMFFIYNQVVHLVS